MQHNKQECAKSCDGCHICRGGLFSCTVCHGAEGTLPTDCPGRAMTKEEQDSVMSGRIDFRGDAWVCPDCNRDPAVCACWEAADCMRDIGDR